MKKQTLTLFLCLLVLGVFSQTVYVGSSGMNIATGSELIVKGFNVTTNGNITGSGTFEMQSTTVQNLSGNNNSINNLEINNTSGIALTSKVTIGKELKFVAGSVDIMANDLEIASGGTITNYSASKKVITSSTGNLVQTVGVLPVLYPIGFNASQYNPATISAAGANNNVSVRVTDNSLEEGNTGSVINLNVVDVRWNINNSDSSKIDITLQWDGAQEKTNFDRTNSGIGYHDDGNPGEWDLSDTIIASNNLSGIDPYTVERTGVSDNGVFAIGDKQSFLYPYVVLQTRVYLQGAYNKTLGVMRDDLRIANLVPTIEPYTALSGFTHTGKGGGEVTTQAVLSDRGNNTNIVDWVFVELRDKASPATILESRAALLRKDGLVVDVDGTSSLKFSGRKADDYFFSVNHRNHLAVMSATAHPLDRTAAAYSVYDFTDPAISADYIADYVKPNSATGITAQFTETNSIKTMYAGDVNADGRIYHSAAPSDANIIASAVINATGNTGNFFNGFAPSPGFTNLIGYLSTDVDMTGATYSAASPSDLNPIASSVINHPANRGTFFNGFTPTSGFIDLVQQLP